MDELGAQFGIKNISKSRLTCPTGILGEISSRHAQETDWGTMWAVIFSRALNVVWKISGMKKL